MKKSKWMLGAAAMLALSVALAGCGGGDKKADNKAGGVKGDLMVYTSIYPDIIDNMCKPNVAKAFPDMKVNWFQGGTEKVITKITGEIKAKKIGRLQVQVEQNLSSNYISGIHLIKKSVEQFIRSVVA